MNLLQKIVVTGKTVAVWKTHAFFWRGPEQATSRKVDPSDIFLEGVVESDGGEAYSVG